MWELLMPLHSIAGLLAAAFLMIQGAYILKRGVIGSPFVQTKRPPLTRNSRVAVGVLYLTVAAVALVLSLAVAQQSLHHLKTEDVIWAILFFVPGLVFIIHPESLVAIAKTAHPELTTTAPGILVCARVIGAGFILISAMIIH
jgi:hypothetical protein